MSPTPQLFVAFSVVLAIASSARADIGVMVAEPVSALGFLTRVGHVATYLSNVCPDGYDFDDVFSPAITTAAQGAAPKGQWKDALATRFDRSMYLFSVETTAAEDATIVAAFNSAPNKSRFNFFYQNCSDQAKGIFDLILPHTTGDRTSGITMQTPKGLAKALVRRALAHPEVKLRVRRYPQIPGTFSASRDVLFPMENTYRNIAFAPYWYWGGFREVALVAMFYHEVVSPFDILASSRDLMSARAAELTREQHRLRQHQDAIRLALTSTQHNSPERLRLSALHARVFRHLGRIRGEKQAEVVRLEGSRAQWQALTREFRTMVRGLSRLALREELRKPLAKMASWKMRMHFKLLLAPGHAERTSWCIVSDIAVTG